MEASSCGSSMDKPESCKSMSWEHSCRTGRECPVTHCPSKQLLVVRRACAQGKSCGCYKCGDAANWCVR